MDIYFIYGLETIDRKDHKYMEERLEQHSPSLGQFVKKHFSEQQNTIFFSNSHSILFKTDHILGYKTNPIINLKGFLN